MLLGACTLCAVSVYVHYSIPLFTEGHAESTLTRALLAATGIGFGAAAVVTFADGEDIAPLAFLVGFGIVHLPAAVILFLKGVQGAGKS